MISVSRVFGISVGSHITRGVGYHKLYGAVRCQISTLETLVQSQWCLCEFRVLFIYLCLFRDAVNISDYVASSNRLTSE